MPLIEVTTCRHLSEKEQASLLSVLSASVAETTGKPEQYVMALVRSGQIMMSGSKGNAAFVDVRSIGALGPEATKAISKRVCEVLRDALEVPGDRIYLNFTDVARTNWGWNGGTFG